MEKLEQAYAAIEMLKALGLPISEEQIKAIVSMERQYLEEEAIPKATESIELQLPKIRSPFRMLISYSPEDGLDVQLQDDSTAQDNLYSGQTDAPKRQRKYIIKVVFPDNHVSCSSHVWETLVDVVRYANPKRVMNLGIIIMGGNLVSSELHTNERYRVGQKEVEPGLYVCTYSSTETKYDQIVKINQKLGLGLKISKVLISYDGEEPTDYSL